MGALHDSISEWNDEQIEWLLEHGADVNAFDDSGNTPLMLAVIRDIYPRHLGLLLERGADIHAKDNSGKTPLMLALDHNALNSVHTLLERFDEVGEQAHVTPEYEHGRLALLFAIYKDDLACVVRLLNEGASVNACSVAGRTPLMLATEMGHAAIVRTLLERGAEVNAVMVGEDVNRWTALHIAAYKPQPECGIVLLEYGAEVDVRDEAGWTPLNWAAWSSSAPLVRALLEHGADVHAENAEGTSPLHNAAWLGNEDTIRTLLAWGAGDNNEHLQSAFSSCFVDNNHDKAAIFIEAGVKVGLHEAILLGDMKMVTSLVTIARVDIHEGQPLLTAAGHGNVEMVRLLLAYGADPNTISTHQQTALMQADWNWQGATEIVYALLDAGADVNIRDENGETAFTMYAQRGHLDILVRMAECGADVNNQNKVGETALMKATRGSDLSVVRFLLKRGANVNLRDQEGRTALIWAVDGGNTAIVHRLLAYGADVSMRDTKGFTALILSQRWPGKRIERLLMETGAKE